MSLEVATVTTTVNRLTIEALVLQHLCKFYLQMRASRNEFRGKNIAKQPPPPLLMSVTPRGRAPLTS